jgi:hypothetical protein
MSTKEKRKKVAKAQPRATKYTHVIRGRVEESLKNRAIQFCKESERPEGWLVRRALEFFLDQEKNFAVTK